MNTLNVVAAAGAPRILPEKGVSVIDKLEAACGLSFLQSARLQMKSRVDNQSLIDRGFTYHRGGLMKFHFTLTPLKDLPLGTVVDGYELVERSHTGKNAVGFRMKDGKFERILLIYVEEAPIEEKLC